MNKNDTIYHKLGRFKVFAVLKQEILTLIVFQNNNDGTISHFMRHFNNTEIEGNYSILISVKWIFTNFLRNSFNFTVQDNGQIILPLTIVGGDKCYGGNISLLLLPAIQEKEKKWNSFIEEMKAIQYDKIEQIQKDGAFRTKKLWLKGKQVKQILPYLEQQSWPQLKTLELDQCEVRDQSVKLIDSVKFPVLEELLLRNTDITDEAVNYVVKLGHLKKLALSKTHITDKGVKQVISKLTNLRKIYLTNEQVTDQGVKQISKLKHLQILSLSNTQITDKTIKQIVKLNDLQTLYLKRTQISNQSKQLLRNHSSLKSIYF